MTDLFSSLADDILALINAKPASPTKDEVVALLQSYLFVTDSGTALYKLPGQHCELPIEEKVVCPATNPWGPHEWSHRPDNPRQAVPRPYCLKCGLDIDNRMSPLFKAPGGNCELPLEEIPISEALQLDPATLKAWADAWERACLDRAKREEQSKQYASLMGMAATLINPGDAVIIDNDGLLRPWKRQP